MSSRLPRPLRLLLVALGAAGVVASAVGGMRAAAAEPLAPSEATRVARGETVVRPETLTEGERRYVGGVTYTVLPASTADLDALFEDVGAWAKVLPRTKRARLVASPSAQVGEAKGDRFVELTQGNALVSAVYTIRVRRTGSEIRFWLAPECPHDIEDAWGSFRFEPFTDESGEPRVLVTYGILVDVGPGLVRELFEEKVRTAMLSVPQLLRRHVTATRRAALVP